ncbi:heptosyltransferase-3 [Arcicella rosea]|uniref:glycosyltransferase family 9 protein n=1 Tax=Arcicella rosea TaxID=502909 RepID=UPI00345C626F
MLKREYCGNRPTKLRLRVLDLLVDFFVFIFRKHKNKAFILPERILLFNFGHLGDMLMMSYMIDIFKKKYPNVEIHIVAGSWCKNLIVNNPLYDKVFFINHYRTNRSALSLYAKFKLYINDINDFLTTHKSLHYTHSFDFRYSGYNANMLFPFLNADQKIGFGTRGMGSLLDIEYYMLPTPFHSVDQQIQSLRSLGIEQTSKNIEPVLSMAVEVNKNFNISGEYFMLFPEAGTRNRMFSNNFWIFLINYLLLKRPEAKVMICGLTEYSTKLKIELEKKHPEKIIDAVGKVSIPQMVPILQKAAGALTLDSFPAHIASTLTSTLCLFKEGTGLEYFPINAKPTYIIHDHKYSKNITSFRKQMKIQYIPSLDELSLPKVATLAMTELFDLK